MNIPVRVKNLVKKYHTRDPLRLAQALGIHVHYKPYANIKGYFTVIQRNKFIVVNANLDELSMQVVLAHELGHALLHHKAAALCYDKGYGPGAHQSLFPTHSIYEKEANQFAAELLIHEDWLAFDLAPKTSYDRSIIDTLITLKS